ncbi:type II secretion system secretin GspD [Maricaulis sp.]|uniref:type II secretion system secretin GspD n=1 Tax=Maricaulis sp. TaxID=1486257 RepID=UPI003A8FF6E4
MFAFAKWIAASLAVLAILAAQPARAQTQDSVVNFNQADIQTVIDDVSAVTGYTFIVEPSVRGRVTITSQTPLTPAEYFQVFLSTMRVHGYVVVPTASGAYQIVPDQAGARSVSPVNSGIRGDQYATEVIHLQHATSQDALAVLRPIVHAQGSVNAAQGSNVLVVVDLAENMQRIREVVRDLDRDTSVFELVELENASAAEMSVIIQRLNARSGGGDSASANGVTIAPLPSSNTLVIRGSAQAVRAMAALVRRVDVASVSNQGFRVVYLNNADGEMLLPILEEMVGALSEGSPDDRRPTVAHHAPTNSLVINASVDVQREVERVIHQLDVRRPQVLVEGIIVEISDSAARELGVQMMLAGGDDSTTPLAFTRYSTSSPDLLALSGALAVPGGTTDDPDATADALREAALASLLGARGAALGLGGELGNGALFGLVLNAVENDVDSNVLATPSILAMDNEEASFISGQEIPVTTGETLGDNNSNPFRTIEREEVGVKLMVRPQITEGGTVRLYIEQEVSSIAGTVVSDSTDLVTNKRRVTTTVLADNGEIIVLGGLIQQDDDSSHSRVPVLGDLPAIGHLFGSRTRTTRRTNLMIFIRPTIIRDAADMRAVTEGRYDYITGQQRLSHPQGASSLEALISMMNATTTQPLDLED